MRVSLFGIFALAFPPERPSDFTIDTRTFYARKYLYVILHIPRTTDEIVWLRINILYY